MVDHLPRKGDYVEFYYWSIFNPMSDGKWLRGLVLRRTSIEHILDENKPKPIWQILGDDGNLYKHEGMLPNTGYEIKLIQRRTG